MNSTLDVAQAAGDDHGANWHMLPLARVKLRFRPSATAWAHLARHLQVRHFDERVEGATTLGLLP